MCTTRRIIQIIIHFHFRLWSSFRLFVAELIPSCIFIPRIKRIKILMFVKFFSSPVNYVIYILSLRNKRNSLNLLPVGVENVYCRVSFQEEQSTSAFKKLLIQEKWSPFMMFAGVRGVAPESMRNLPNFLSNCWSRCVYWAQGWE